MKTRTGYLIKRGRTFYAVWTVDGKKYMKTTRKTNRREAKTELARIMEPFLVADEMRTLETIKARIEGGSATLARLEQEQSPPVTILQAWASYVAAPTESRRNRRGEPVLADDENAPANRPDSGESTMRQYECQFGAFQRWIKGAHTEARYMRDVTPAVARDYAAHLGKSVGPATFNKHMALLTLVWRVLANPARIERNPWDGIGRKRAAPESRRELTVDELRRLCGSATGELRLLLAVGLYSGLRLGDASTLRWEETDLAQGVIRRIPMKTGRRNPKPVRVPIHPILAAMLAETPGASRKGYVLPETAAMYLRRRDAVSRLVQAHFTQCGIQTTKAGTGVKTVAEPNGKPQKVRTGKRAVVEAGYHSLRHSFVSLCRAADVPLAVVEAIVGHASPAMTRHYTHTGDDAALAAVSTLPSVMGDEPLTLPPVDPVAAMRERVRGLADKLDGKNWRKVKEALGEVAEG